VFGKTALLDISRNRRLFPTVAPYAQAAKPPGQQNTTRNTRVSVDLVHLRRDQDEHR